MKSTFCSRGIYVFISSFISIFTTFIKCKMPITTQWCEILERLITCFFFLNGFFFPSPLLRFYERSHDSGKNRASLWPPSDGFAPLPPALAGLMKSASSAVAAPTRLTGCNPAEQTAGGSFCRCICAVIQRRKKEKKTRG